MIIRGTPTNLDDFICADNEFRLFIEKSGYSPLYMDNRLFYFVKTDELMEVVKNYG